MTESTSSTSLNKKYREITVKSVEDVLRWLDVLGNHVFRGHLKKEWGLQTTFERAVEGVPPENRLKLERKVILEFRRRAQHYLSNLPEPDQYLEWLALMQHHGCPTRLLDFTRSHYIALFFAVENTDSDSAVWAVDRTFYETRPEVPASEDHLYSTYNENAEKRVNELLSTVNEQECKSGLLLVEPCRMNERLSIQQGVFLFPENLKSSFEENLCSHQGALSLDELAEQDGTSIIVKMIIPQKLHLRIAILLSAMNISAATLFPGLDGYARSQKLHIQSAQLTLQERRDFQGRWLNIFKSIRDRRKAGQERQRMDGSREEG